MTQEELLKKSEAYKFLLMQMCDPCPAQATLEDLLNELNEMIAEKQGLMTQLEQRDRQIEKLLNERQELIFELSKKENMPEIWRKQEMGDGFIRGVIRGK